MAGYITLSRAAQNKSGWRNVHISKRSFEKFVEHLPVFEEAMQNKTKHQLMLTRKQHVVTTQLVREGKETLYFVSVMHPTEEKETLQLSDSINHAKTINLNCEEFGKLILNKNLLVQTRSSTPAENEESALIDGFRWLYRQTGERSNKIFLTRDECITDARYHYIKLNLYEFHAQPDEHQHESHYNFTPIQVQRPSKLELIEHLAYAIYCATIELYEC